MLKYLHIINWRPNLGRMTSLFERRENSEVKLLAFRLSAYLIKVKLCAQVVQNFSKPANGLQVSTCKILFAQVDLFNFGADLIIFVEQLNELLLYLTEL